MTNVLSLPRGRMRPASAAATGRLLELAALHRHAQGDARWLKDNAEVLRLLVTTGQHAEAAVLDRVHRQTVRDLPDRLTFFPQYYRFFLSIALDLSALGLPVDAPALVARAFDDGLPEAELSDLQRAEAELFGLRAGVIRARDEALHARLIRFGSRAETFALPNKKAAYELTHIAFYLSDYGRQTVPEGACLQAGLLNAGLVAWLEQNTDLLSEICVALRFCGAEPPAAWDDAVARDLAAFRLVPGAAAAGPDGLHCWMMAAWAVSAQGGAPLERPMPEGPLALVAPQRPSALHEISAALMDMDAARCGDWPVMRRRLSGRLSVAAMDLMDQAASSTAAFEPFFDRFARVCRKGHAA